MNAKIHPRDRANFISKVTLWWIVDLLWRGNHNPLNHEDLDSVREGDRAKLLTKHLEEIWKNEKLAAKRHKRNPKLWKATLKFFSWKDYALLGFAFFVSISGYVLDRYSVLMLMNAVGSNFEGVLQSRNIYLVCVWGMILGSALESFGTRHFNLIPPMMGIRLRAALVAMIYQKVLKSSKTMINAGEVMELICNDTQRLVTMADRSFAYFVRKVLCCVVYISWLFCILGWRIIPGLLVFVLIAIFRILITNIDVNLRRKASNAAEKRLGYLREVLTIIHSVKMNCLEHVYEKKVQETRWQEIVYKAKRWLFLSVIFSFSTCGQQLSTFAVIMLVIFTVPSLLTFYNLFAIMLLFANLSEVFCTDVAISAYYSIDLLTTLTRIQRFLERHDVKNDVTSIGQSTSCDYSEFHEKLTDGKKLPETFTRPPYVWLDNVTCGLFTSDVSSADVTLLNEISMKISSKGLVMITGSVGSGKSSLLASILPGELRVAKGSVKHSGNIAYVSDTPWVFPGTVRENILFGLPYDEMWYLETIKVCELEKDFERFPERDLSHIGEHGATLSGGQRTRITLARAVYSRADIYLLDDPLSSLDAKVAENIFKNVVTGIFSERIVVLITHKYLSEADYIVKLNKGRVVAQGSIEEVREKHPEIEVTLNKNKLVGKMDRHSEHVETKVDLSQAKQLHEAEEDRKVGRVSFEVDLKYCVFGAPPFLLFMALLIILAGQGLVMWVDIQVSSLPKMVNQKEKIHQTLLVYLFSLIAAVLFTVLSKCCVFLLPIRANYKLHNKMVACLLQAPAYFYAVNPTGRILNRFSQDINNLDDLLPFNLAYLFQCATISLGMLALCVVANALLIPAAVVILIISYGVSRFFFNSAMDIKRLMSESGGPLYSHFSNTLEGLRTIRVHERQEMFTDVVFSLIDRHHQAMFAYFAAARWFGLVIDLIFFVFSSIVATTELYSVNDPSTAVIAAVAILYSFQSAINAAAVVRCAVEVQAQLTSAERILAYTEIEPETGREIKEQSPKKWPGCGEIRFENVSLRHYKEGPKVLKDLSFQIDASEKVGIVGRTGAGKSSLVAALMRTGETEGNIVIDNMSIGDLNVLSTRQRISVISQSPVLFNGSIRENLNPSGDLSDAEIWDVLYQTKLGLLVRNLPHNLDSECTGGGSNFSVGQRQLFHLARVLLKRNKIIIFDEATSKVDKNTAEQIREVIHGVFEDCTVITISHCMDTIENCDRIMVLEQGSIVEFDRPDVLLDKKKGFFLELVRIANERFTKIY